MSRLADIYRNDIKEDAPQHVETAPNAMITPGKKAADERDADAFSIASGVKKEFAHMEEGGNPPKGMDGEIAAMLAASGERVHLTPEDNKVLKRMIDKRVLSVML
jgi:hypothetical protein